MYEKRRATPSNLWDPRRLNREIQAHPRHLNRLRWDLLCRLVYLFRLLAPHLCRPLQMSCCRGFVAHGRDMPVQRGVIDVACVLEELRVVHLVLMESG